MLTKKVRAFHVSWEKCLSEKIRNSAVWKAVEVTSSTKKNMCFYKGKLDAGRLPQGRVGGRRT